MNKEIKAKPPEAQNASITELLGQLATDSATFIREEVALAKQEFKEKIQSLRNGAIMFAVGATLVLVAFLTLWAAFIIWLTNFLPPATVALITGGGMALLGAIITIIGIKLFQKTTAEPIKTVEAVQGRTGNG